MYKISCGPRIADLGCRYLSTLDSNTFINPKVFKCFRNFALGVKYYSAPGQERSYAYLRPTVSSNLPYPASFSGYALYTLSTDVAANHLLEEIEFYIFSQ